MLTSGRAEQCASFSPRRQAPWTSLPRGLYWFSLSASGFSLSTSRFILSTSGFILSTSRFILSTSRFILSTPRWKTLSRKGTQSCQSSHRTLDSSGGNCLDRLDNIDETFWTTLFCSGTWALASTRQRGRHMLCPTMSPAVRSLRSRGQLRSGSSLKLWSWDYDDDDDNVKYDDDVVTLFPTIRFHCFHKPKSLEIA